MNPKNDVLVKATRKAYLSSAVGQLEMLLKLRGKWERRLTIALNKIDNATYEIDKTALQLAKESDACEPSIRGNVLARAKR